MSAESQNLALLLHPDQVKRDLDIDQIDINVSMMRQAGLFAYYASLHARADAAVAKAEQMVDITEATLDKQIRDRAAAAGEKKTEAQIKSLIQTDPIMIRRRQALNEAVMLAAIAKSTAEAFRHRRDMLVQIGFNLREEIKGGVQIGEKQTRDAASVRAARAEALREQRGSAG